MKPNPRTVVLISGWSLCLLGVIYLLSGLVGLGGLSARSVAVKPTDFLTASHIVGSLVGLFSAIAGMGLLCMKEWARKMGRVVAWVATVRAASAVVVIIVRVSLDAVLGVPLAMLGLWLALATGFGKSAVKEYFQQKQ